MVRHTGVHLSFGEYDEIQRLIREGVTMQIDLARGINVTNYDRRAAIARLQELAKEKGLPDLDDGRGYGLTSDRELVHS